MERICINPKCGWIGNESECLDWKHPTGARLCPQCHDVTEEMCTVPTPNDEPDIQELIDDQIYDYLHDGNEPTAAGHGYGF